MNIIQFLVLLISIFNCKYNQDDVEKIINKMGYEIEFNETIIFYENDINNPIGKGGYNIKFDFEKGRFQLIFYNGFPLSCILEIDDFDKNMIKNVNDVFLEYGYKINEYEDYMTTSSHKIKYFYNNADVKSYMIFSEWIDEKIIDISPIENWTYVGIYLDTKIKYCEVIIN
jgi:hypothetical protein